MTQVSELGIVKTRKRVLSKRGVMWLGQTCNQRCYFCYFIDRILDHSHPEHAFMSLEKAKRITSTLRYFYGNRAIDIQGGEPTVHREILELIRHCREIGLIPTLITNGLMLYKPGVLEKYREAGLRDFLVSLHGIGDIHDEVVGVKGAYKKITASLERMREINFPFRLNCTMSKPVVPIIPEVAGKAVEYGANAVNFIAFNPFSDQSGQRRADTVALYSEIKPQLDRAMDILEEAGIEVNVRYLPMCMAEPRHRKNFYNFQQLSYDVHEWDYQSWLWTMMMTQMMHDGNPSPPMKLGPGCRRLYKARASEVRDRYESNPVIQGAKFRAQHMLATMQQLVRGKETMYREEARTRAAQDCGYKRGVACKSCNLRDICDGFHGDYAEFFGTDEARAVTDVPHTEDPLVFIREQEKVVMPEDRDWAL
ncbi:MAG: radical SAM protein [Candidatus Hydrogenedens sp.]|nr:radical SAM protein [Candidatus Hydrogenedentota bacterium]NLF59091.1 radical SAM protein [Candidatus Hydrogenedens sp.]